MAKPDEVDKAIQLAEEALEALMASGARAYSAASVLLDNAADSSPDQRVSALAVLNEMQKYYQDRTKRACSLVYDYEDKIW